MRSGFDLECYSASRQSLLRFLHPPFMYNPRGPAFVYLLQVTDVIHDSAGKATGAAVVDKMTGKKFSIKAKGVVNATGELHRVFFSTALPVERSKNRVIIYFPLHASPSVAGPFGDGIRLMDDPTAQPLIVGASGECYAQSLERCLSERASGDCTL